MLKEESNESVSTWSKPCDTCRLSSCTVYCDARAQASANHVASRHERVLLVCQSCESAPATFMCKADDASLCTSCDAEIHSANPLASRHQRVPILATKPCSSMTETHADNGDDDEVASWFLLNPQGKSINHNNGFLFGVEYLDLVDYNQFEDHEYSYYQRSFGLEDGVVPLHHVQESMQQSVNNNYGFSSSEEAQYNNYNGSLKNLNHTVSVSSMDISVVVPESTESDPTVQYPRTSSPPTLQLTPVEREAKVLRYREKKKTRRFEKTIRYASRKAYAEIRPRIKGRFAKRIESETDAEQLFSASIMSDTGYDIVPSF
ncbi:unnamed protein product [Cochlearia groenlandica]